MSSNIKIKKLCEHCGAEFIARTTTTKYCCHRCNQKAYKANVRELRLQLSKTDPKIEVKQSKPKQNPDNYFDIKTLDYLTVREAAVLLKCDRRTVYRLIKSGRLPAGNLSIRRIRILKKDIDALFVIQIESIQGNSMSDKDLESTPLKDCFTIGQVLKEYNLSETSLRSLIKRHKIPKFQKGKFVYVPKKLIEPILNKILLNEYFG
ncbi:helix-turn-helix domain-containing protein [Chryseobacterium sp. DT-3]|uniref:helix-turn-helix domain-containing protein n=1 Tax=Chryseobacterium sp. DT-3 TaxID=3396164 RepID=UPI003F1B8EC6